MSIKFIPALSFVQSQLNTLSVLLQGLPDDLPTDVYCFDGFSEQFEFTCNALHNLGSDGCLNCYLERILAPLGRKDGIILKGRGPGLEAVVELLAVYITEHPENAILHKWVDNLVDAAVMAGAYVS
jgi:hypothetical protein